MVWYCPLEDFGRWQVHAGRELQKGDDPGVHSYLPGWHPKETASYLPSRAVCFINATPSRRPDAVGSAPLVTSLRGLWVSGYLPRAMADRAQGRRPENRPGDDSDPGLASRRDGGLNCQKRYSQTSVVSINALRREGTRRPWTACARLRRGGLIRYDVAASYYLLWYDTGGRSHTSAFSSHYWSSPSRAILSISSILQFFCLSAAYHLWGSRTTPPSPRLWVSQFQIASFDTPSVRENAAQFLFWVSLVLWRSPLTNGW